MMKHILFVYFLFIIAMVATPFTSGLYQIIPLGSTTLGMIIVWKGRFWQKGRSIPLMSSHMKLLRTLIVIFLVGAVFSSFQWLTYFDRYGSSMPLNTFFQVMHISLWVLAIGVLCRGIYLLVAEAFTNRLKLQREKKATKKLISIPNDDDNPVEN